MSRIDISKDVRFLQTALAVARIWSKDPSSQVAAIAVGDTPNQVAWGYNGFPPGIADTHERLTDRDTKYRLTRHAEPNALSNAWFPVRTLYVTHHPCADCVIDILAARTVKRVVFVFNESFEERWHESLKVARALFSEGGISIEGVVL